MAFKQTFSSFTELNATMNDKLRLAQEKTLDKMLEKLKDFIEDEVYKKSEPRWYSRTYDLDKIWEKTKVYIKSGTVYGSIKPSNDSALSHNAEFAQHTSPQHATREDRWGRTVSGRQNQSGGELNTYDYVNIINKGLSESHSMFGAIEKRPFWDDFLKWAEQNYSRIFAESCQEVGLPISGGSSRMTQVGSVKNITI